MQPQTPQSPNPYDFITNPRPAPKKPGFALGGGSMVKQLAIIVGGLLVLTIIVSLVMNLLSGGGSTEALKNLAAEQQEIVRIAELGAESATTADSRGYALTVGLSVQTDQARMLELLSNNGTKVEPKQLGLKEDSTVDVTLESAASTNSYDETFKEIIDTRLSAYLAALASAHDAASSEEAKSVLANSYESTSALLGKTE